MPTMDLVEKRAAWIVEEVNEMLEAVAEGDFVKYVDALDDILYFAFGGGVIAGVEIGDDTWDNVQRANMAKLGPDGKPVPHPTLPGKIGKPEGWVPPEASHMLTLRKIVHDVRIEGLARQLAYAEVTGAEVTIVDKLSVDDLNRAVSRANDISARGQAQKYYDEMLAGLAGIDEELQLDEDLKVKPQAQRIVFIQSEIETATDAGEGEQG
jgi:hypothetical protein